MTLKPKIKQYASKKEVAEAFSQFFAGFTNNKSNVNVALSGGSTPKIVFDFLAENFKDEIDWSTINLWWGDERCVPPGDKDSNYKMTVDHLISKIKIPEDNVYRILGESEPEAEAKRYAQLIDHKIPKENGVPLFDLVILGMGDDGHTASIFPHEIKLWKSAKNCVVAKHPESGQERISITGKIINNAYAVAFLVTGESKAEKVETILKGGDAAKKFPASLVKPDSGNLLWFVDNAAAKNL